MQESSELQTSLKENFKPEADPLDLASNMNAQTFELKNKDRCRKLIRKIEAALKRIEDGTYGYCEETGEPIGLKRLEARPIATLCIAAQERHEKHEKDFRTEDEE